MSKDKAHGSKWVVVRRCQKLLMRLLQGAATSQELLDIVLADAKLYGERLTFEAAQKRLEEDRYRLREFFGCEIAYSRSSSTYSLETIETGYIDLPPEALRGLAFLQTTFKAESTPMGGEVKTLLQRLMMMLSKRRRDEVERERGLLELNLHPRDQDIIYAETWDALERACSECRQLEFDYLARSQKDGISRRHLVEPFRYFFNPMRGHYYLQAYCIEVWGPHGQIPQDEMRTYRLGRMFNPRLLPTHFKRDGRRIKKYELTYRLSAEIASPEPTQHFPDSTPVPQPDGSVIVHAMSFDLFFDLRTLLYYGANCRVLGGDEAIDQMKSLVKQMYERYHEAPNF